MSWWAALKFRVRSLFQKKGIEAEMAAELAEHLQLRIDRNREAGMSSEEAEREARRSFGGVEQVKEHLRRERDWVWFEQLRQDLVYASRQLTKAPGFASAVILTLALGIGATTAIFSVVNAIILDPVPGTAPDRLLQIGQRDILMKQEMLMGVSPPVWDALATQRDFFAGLAWSDDIWLDRKTDDFVVREAGALVSGDFFRVLEAHAQLGRTLGEPDVVPRNQAGGLARDAAMVLSFSWWQSAFAGDRGILNRTVELDGRHFTVVGVMPDFFQFPSPKTQYWIAAEPGRATPPAIRAPVTQVLARLKPGTDVRQTEALVGLAARRLMADYPGNAGYGGMWRRDPAGLRIWVRPLAVTLFDGRGSDELRQTLFGLLAAIGFVLLLVCANVANLVLARLESRQHELAVRRALGASRGRIARQLLTENVFLALLGGAAGLWVAAWGIRVLAAMSSLPRLRPIAMDGTALSVALAISLVTAVAFGLVPIVQGARARGAVALLDGGRHATGGRRRSAYRAGLVIAQVAATVLLVTGAGLTIKSVINLLDVNPGFNPGNLLLADVPLPSGKYDLRDTTLAQNRRMALYAQLHDRFAALPGVGALGTLHSYGVTWSVPAEGKTENFFVQLTGCGVGADDPFRALEAPLLAGRWFEPDDIRQTAPALINEAMARLCWPGENAIGKTFTSGSTSRVVVGVVGDVRIRGYTEEVQPTFYRPVQEGSGMRIIGGPPVRFILRTSGDPRALVAPMRAALKEVEANLELPKFSIAKDVLFDSTQAQRTYRNYLGIFAGAGLLLSALGIYGVLSYSVTRRTREIGIRLAIGADQASVIALVVGEGARLVSVGIAGGLLAAFWLTRFLRAQLFQVDPLDPVVMGIGVAVVIGMALLACWLPARRAAGVNPAVALRAE